MSASEAGKAPTTQRSVVPPRLLDAPSVPYPPDAHGDAKVVVVLTVNTDGSVRSAQAVGADAPFADTAVESVKHWRFAPATRDGAPVAATIRVQVEFYAPVVSGPEASTTPSGPDGATGKDAASAADSKSAERPRQAQRPIEVTVLGERQAPMVTSLSRTEVRQLPGTFGDPFRAIEIMPGVTPIISGLPFFYVRGAPPGNVGYFLDGIRVPYLYHVAIGPSVIQPGMVESVDLYPGGYPARYGRYAGGIVSAETTAPRVTPHGEGNIRIFDAGGLVESGFAGGRGTVLLGGRYSYTAAILSLLTPNAKLDYRDYQARVTYDLTPRDQVSMVAFGAYDLLAQDINGISTIAFGSEFYRGDFRYDHQIGKSGRVRTAITLGYDQTAIGGQRNAQDRMISGRSEFDQQLTSNTHLRVGIDAVSDSYKITTPVYRDPDDPSEKLFDDLFPPRRDVALGAHAELGIQVQKGFLVTPGFRVDRYSSGSATKVGLDPRLSARLRVREGLSLVQSFGIAHQPPSFVLPVPGLALGSLANGLQTAYQTSAGIEWQLLPSTKLTANAFDNVFTDLTDALSIPEGRGDSLNRRALGRAYGLEFFLHRTLTQRLGGFLSYTLSRSTRRVDNAVFPSAFDRRHVFNGALAFDLGRKWRAGTRLVFYTGAPQRTKAPAATTTTDAPAAPAVGAGTPASDPARDPAFYRIDLRLEKLWMIGKTAHLSFVAEMLNATLKKEVYNGNPIGPIAVPSIGLEGVF